MSAMETGKDPQLAPWAVLSYRKVECEKSTYQAACNQRGLLADLRSKEFIRGPSARASGTGSGKSSRALSEVGSVAGSARSLAKVPSQGSVKMLVPQSTDRSEWNGMVNPQTQKTFYRSKSTQGFGPEQGEMSHAMGIEMHLSTVRRPAAGLGLSCLSAPFAQDRQDKTR
eukprot:TRINITY_DN66153_c0_g1_i1.p1 TRINITY_DN66153_c0_g1~~TRINITY_DN66153_c0_g1_i1.p1  ORF type:complete len:170 (-),score=6.08 TRINITY_DN66153_c0_g1_i1:55-564(-)